LFVLTLAEQAELCTVASALRGLPNQSAAESATQELAVLFESFSAMLARNASASASQAALSAGAIAATMLPGSPYRTISSSSPTHIPYGGSLPPKSAAEHSFLTISREVEVSYGIYVTCSSFCNSIPQALRKFAAQTLKNSSATEPASASHPECDFRPYLDDPTANMGPELPTNMVFFL
jgi:hypothetical protein